MCICITESLCRAPEALSINYTSIQYIYTKKKKKDQWLPGVEVGWVKGWSTGGSGRWLCPL